jgi:hypothetical protein
MPTKTATPTKKATAPAKTAAPAKKAAARRPVKQSAAALDKAIADANKEAHNGDEPLIRIAFGAEDLERLIDYIEGWDDPVAHRLRLRYSKHRQRH